MAIFREPGELVTRIALTSGCVAYLGLLPSFLVQLRWLPDMAVEQSSRGTRLAGDLRAEVLRHRRVLHRPALRPAPHDAGAQPEEDLGRPAGGLVLATSSRSQSVIRTRAGQYSSAMTGGRRLRPDVGLAGMLGDLAESLIKRDCQQKDASQAVPGFGGVLDVVDSILFAPRWRTCWLTLGPLTALGYAGELSRVEWSLFQSVRVPHSEFADDRQADDLR